MPEPTNRTDWCDCDNPPTVHRKAQHEPPPVYPLRTQVLKPPDVAGITLTVEASGDGFEVWIHDGNAGATDDFFLLSRGQRRKTAVRKARAILLRLSQSLEGV